VGVVCALCYCKVMAAAAARPLLTNLESGVCLQSPLVSAADRNASRTYFETSKRDPEFHLAQIAQIIGAGDKGPKKSTHVLEIFWARLVALG
jgi:hypothetical protein